MAARLCTVSTKGTIGRAGGGGRVGTIRQFPLTPNELTQLAKELLQPGIKFTQARYKTRYGAKKFEAIRYELLACGWGQTTYQNSVELTPRGRAIMEGMAR